MVQSYVDCENLISVGARVLIWSLMFRVFLESRLLGFKRQDSRVRYYLLLFFCFWIQFSFFFCQILINIFLETVNDVNLLQCLFTSSLGNQRVFFLALP